MYIVYKPLVSWDVESVNSLKLTIQEVQGALSSRPTGDPFFTIFYFCQITLLMYKKFPHFTTVYNNV